MILIPGRQKLTFNGSLPIKIVRGTVYTHVHFRLTQTEFYVFTNVGIQTNNIHFVFPLLNSVKCLCGFGSTPVQGVFYTGCPRRNVPDYGRVFLMLKYIDITQITSVQR